MSTAKEIGRATMHLGDCLEVMETLEHVDAIITDPPYCSGAFTEAGRQGAKSQGIATGRIKALRWFTGDNMGTAGLAFLMRSVAFRAVEILSPAGSLLVFCDWRMVPSLAPAIESAGYRYHGLVVWDKGSAGLGMGFRCQHELVLHFTVGSPKYYDLGTANVIRAVRVRGEDREHQAQKPVDLLQRLIRVVTPPDGIVLDPFAGSGSTGVAAIAEGRRFIGIERDPHYVATACERLEQCQRQGSLLEATHGGESA